VEKSLVSCSLSQINKQMIRLANDGKNLTLQWASQQFARQ
jgi:hypothetical protein